jgi:hypothetical protein
MLYRPNDDAIGNHFEVFGYEGWPELQDNDLADWNPWEDPDRRDDE